MGVVKYADVSVGVAGGGARTLTKGTSEVRRENDLVALSCGVWGSGMEQMPPKRFL